MHIHLSCQNLIQLILVHSPLLITVRLKNQVFTIEEALPRQSKTLLRTQLPSKQNSVVHK